MTQEEIGFDFSAALKAIQEGKPLLGREGILTPLIKNLTEAALEGELDSHLGQQITANRRNGKAGRPSNRSMVILSCKPLVTVPEAFPRNWSRSIRPL